MSDGRQYYLYMLASKTRRLYVGMTNDLHRRVLQHRMKAIDGFTSRYNIERLSCLVRVHRPGAGRACP